MKSVAYGTIFCSILILLAGCYVYFLPEPKSPLDLSILVRKEVAGTFPRTITDYEEIDGRKVTEHQIRYSPQESTLATFKLDEGKVNFILDENIKIVVFSWTKNSFEEFGPDYCCDCSVVRSLSKFLQVSLNPLPPTYECLCYPMNDDIVITKTETSVVSLDLLVDWYKWPLKTEREVKRIILTQP